MFIGLGSFWIFWALPGDRGTRRKLTETSGTAEMLSGGGSYPNILLIS